MKAIGNFRQNLENFVIVWLCLIFLNFIVAFDFPGIPRSFELCPRIDKSVGDSAICGHFVDMSWFLMYSVVYAVVYSKVHSVVYSVLNKNVESTF